MKISYNWLKWYIPDVPEADKLNDIFTYHLTEVEGVEKVGDDTIFDLNILPNRAHDLLSHKGVARELAGQLGLSFVDPKSVYEGIIAKKDIQKTDLSVDIQTDGCRRYSARIIRNIKVGPSPEWVVKHLESIGERSINNIVDATNLVMYNCGQPTHAYDLAKLGEAKIVVRNAQDSEELALVGRSGIVAKLKDSDIVICDSNLHNIALAGVKGGTESGINDSTVDIVLEVANFDPISVRKTARRIGVLSDAAKRFENNMTPELCDFAMLELSALLMETCPDAIMEEIVDIYPNKDEWNKKNKITFKTNIVCTKLGLNITDLEIENILKNYGYDYSVSNSLFEVTVPNYRLDLKDSIDMIEEIGRVYGYDKIVPKLPNIRDLFTSKDNNIYTKIKDTRNDLVLKGYCEVMNYTFVKKGDIQVARGVKGKDFLRTNLSDGLKDSYEMNRLNAPLINIDEVKIFEIGTVFINNNEEVHVAFIDKKEIKEMEINEYVLDINNVIINSSSINNSKFEMWSVYPFITRDISVWVPTETNQNELENIYKTCGSSLLVHDPRCVDKFEKDGLVSYSYRMVFQAKDKTLKDEDVNIVMNLITDQISKHSDWIIR